MNARTASCGLLPLALRPRFIASSATPGTRGPCRNGCGTAANDESPCRYYSTPSSASTCISSAGPSLKSCMSPTPSTARPTSTAAIVAKCA
jgi:hypothetical protein